MSTEPCSVCLEEISQPCETPCGHVFCNECLRGSLKFQRPWTRGNCPLCRTAISLFSVRDAQTGDPLEMPPHSTIFGAAYLQRGTPGVAAYHFEAPDSCYISYEHAPDGWRLDDGSRPPDKKPFDNPMYDAATRTFTGSIDWSDAPFNGAARWEYEMIFAEDFVLISGGQLNCFDIEGNHTSTKYFPRDLVYARAYDPPESIVGQAYMQNGGLGLASYHFPSIDEAYISYEAAPPEWALDNGTRPPSMKPFDNPRYDAESRTFTGAIVWGDTPFGGDARWEYEMVFSEDFKTIASGQVRRFDPAGTARRPHPFGRHGLHYVLYSEDEAQLFHLFMNQRFPRN